MCHPPHPGLSPAISAPLTRNTSDVKHLLTFMPCEGRGWMGEHCARCGTAWQDPQRRKDPSRPEWGSPFSPSSLQPFIPAAREDPPGSKPTDSSWQLHAARKQQLSNAARHGQRCEEVWGDVRRCEEALVSCIDVKFSPLACRCRFSVSCQHPHNLHRPPWRAPNRLQEQEQDHSTRTSSPNDTSALDHMFAHQPKLSGQGHGFNALLWFRKIKVHCWSVTFSASFAHLCYKYSITSFEGSLWAVCMHHPISGYQKRHVGRAQYNFKIHE